MVKVFGIFLVVFMGWITVGAADEANVETELMSKIDESLDAAVRCKITGLPIGSAPGNMLGKELGIWWTKRGYKNKNVIPLIEFAKAQKDAEDAAFKIKVEVEVFRKILLDEPVFKKCPSITEMFFTNVETYIEYVTARDL